MSESAASVANDLRTSARDPSLPRRTSITDQPLKEDGVDELDIQHYAHALSRFIIQSATPLTIGMQGEWGTGKTSLMFLVKGLLDPGKVATAWINTWEYSLFKNAAETAPAVLAGLLTNLVNARESKPDATQKRLGSALVTLGSIALKAAKAAVKHQTGVDVDELKANDDPGTNGDLGWNNPDNPKSKLAHLKEDIQKIVGSIIKEEELEKIVFFIDDLDRIEPVDAVEVLEALKNIFDIEGCVFVLAIDYDVVVKGLEKKFGQKTDSNEREFRSFFDKIIQVPFSMPVAAYEIDDLLRNKLKELGLEIQDDLKEYVEVVKLTVESNPRSLKRYINSYSLLHHIREIKNGNNDNVDQEDIFALFALIGIQISYPKLFRHLVNDQNYIGWGPEFASKLKLNADDLKNAKEEIQKFRGKKRGEWEQVVWAFCQQDPFLKIRATDILELLERIRKRLKTDERLVKKLRDAMLFASMTTVDDSPEAKRPKDTSEYRFKGEKYRKGRLVLAVVKAYVEERLQKSGTVTLKELDRDFPDHLQGGYGVFKEKGEVEEKKKIRYFDEQIHLMDSANSTIVVCSQWGTNNIDKFIAQAKRLKFEITRVDDDKDS